MEMLQQLGEGMAFVMTWPYLGWVIVGTVVALFFGTLPGLNGVMATALIIPFTFGLPKEAAIVLLTATVAGGTFGGAITAILINTPGDAVNAATTYDGFPLAKQGKAGVAIGAACTASALGSLFGLFVLILVIPFARVLILSLSYPELFLITMIGLIVVAIVSRGNMLKGLIIGFVGLLLSFVGLDPFNGAERFTGGSLHLMDGIGLIPVTVGIFALAEAVKMFLKGGTVSEKPISLGKEVWGQVLQGSLAVFKHFGVFIRGSMIGTVIGSIPGLGGTIANFLAYSQAVQTAKDKSMFGKGDIRGVIASESSNDAKDGGSLIPTLAFGIPGSASMAVLLGALIFHGVAPGRSLLTDNIHMVYIIICSAIAASILTSIIGIMFVKSAVWLTLIDVRIMVPIIVILSLIGTYSLKESVGDVIVAVVFGIIGILLAFAGYPVQPLVIGLILGSLLEVYLYNIVEFQGIGIFFTRPISIGLLLFLLITIFFVIRGEWKSKQEGKNNRYTNMMKG